jgi:hypothetical protein
MASSKLRATDATAGGSSTGGDQPSSQHAPLTPSYKRNLLALYKSGTATGPAKRPPNLDSGFEHFSLAPGITAHRSLTDPTMVHVENTSGPVPTYSKMKKGPATHSSPQE